MGFKFAGRARKIINPIPFAELSVKFSSLFVVMMLSRVLSLEGMGVYAYIVSLVMLSSVFMDFGGSQKAYVLGLRGESNGVAPLFMLRGFSSMIALFFLASYEYVASEYVLEVLTYSFTVALVSVLAFLKMYYRGRSDKVRDAFFVLCDPVFRLIVVGAIFLFLDAKLLWFLLGMLCVSFTCVLFALNFIVDVKVLYLQSGIFKRFKLTLYELTPYFFYYGLFVFFQRMDLFFVKGEQGVKDVAIYFGAFNLYSVVDLFFCSWVSSALPEIIKTGRAMLGFIFVVSLVSIGLIYFLSGWVFFFVYPESYSAGAKLFSFMVFCIPFHFMSYYFILRNNLEGKVLNNVFCLAVAVLLKVVLYIIFKPVFLDQVVAIFVLSDVGLCAILFCSKISGRYYERATD